MVIMKTNTRNNHHKKPFHLHVEHLLRMPALVIGVVSLLLIAILKADSKLMGMVREAYADGYGTVGAYMREETVRSPASLATMRANNISGQ